MKRHRRGAARPDPALLGELIGQEQRGIADLELCVAELHGAIFARKGHAGDFFRGESPFVELDRFGTPLTIRCGVIVCFPGGIGCDMATSHRVDAPLVLAT